MSKNKNKSRKKSSTNSTVRKSGRGSWAGGLQKSAADYWGQKSPVLKFLLGFAGCMVVFYLIYLSPFFVDHFGRPLLHVQAKISSLILNLLGQGTIAVKDVISGDGYSISIKNGCDGLETLAIMLSGIVVFPIAFRLKWPGIVYGTLALMALNFVRIVALFLVGKNFSQGVFDFLHEQGGFVIFTVLGVFLWIFWANWALAKTASDTPKPKPGK